MIAYRILNFLSDTTNILLPCKSCLSHTSDIKIVSITPWVHEVVGLGRKEQSEWFKSPSPIWYHQYHTVLIGKWDWHRYGTLVPISPVCIDCINSYQLSGCMMTIRTDQYILVIFILVDANGFDLSQPYQYCSCNILFQFKTSMGPNTIF